MSVVKKFGDFVKSINEDAETINVPIEETDGENITHDLEEEDSSNLVDEPDYDLNDEEEENYEEEYEEDDDIDYEEDMEDSFEEEEESGTYKGTLLMQELADMLGSEVIDNEIEYDGKIINYYSETENFHVDGEKFETPGEVVEYLEGGSPEFENPISEIGIGESRRFRNKRLSRF